MSSSKRSALSLNSFAIAVCAHLSFLLLPYRSKGLNQASSEISTETLRHVNTIL
ncbi:hypothetical protein HMPREF0239_03277 [Clostridium sp. ATCC BAA-442]|nr:hypothetical protein HMPREF0239_03277 [Clostridium sp. ATCC BAA-442]